MQTGLASATEYEWQVQSNCGGGDVSAYSASTVFTTSGGGGGCSDVYEANETIGNAAVVSTNVTLHGLISTTTDVDWYKFTTSNPNTKINVTLTSLPADYDMRLYNQNGKQKGVSQNGGTTDEQLIWNTSKAGNRYIKVYGWSGAHDASDCYDLLISVQSANWRTDGLMLEQVWDNSVVGIYPNPATGANVTIDYFSVQEDMNVQVAVYDILGNRVQSFNQAVEGGENMIDMDVTQMNAGVYLVVISNGKSNYTGRFIVN
ncbi:MAG: T9SS type A sorting domain-containing protein [Chitinophagales bacterium]